MRSLEPLSVVLRGLAAGVVLCAFALFTLEAVMAADPVEVPHPTLPKGAGQLDADAPKTFATTASGLQYRVLRKGTGANPKATNTVKVHYHGWLDGGKVFDSSYSRGESIEFPLNGVIPGWTEGMQLVGEEGMIELLIPSKLGYGKRGAPPVIPPDATLHFLVELLDVK
jgi:FKBP-type peptidyl-prolyl cis-trans isomerase FkpA